MSDTEHIWLQDSTDCVTSAKIKDYTIAAANIEAQRPNDFRVEIYLMDVDTTEVVAGTEVVFERT